MCKRSLERLILVIKLNSWDKFRLLKKPRLKFRNYYWLINAESKEIINMSI